MILVLAGTGEGRRVAADLEREGRRVIASTATEYGGALLRGGFKGEINTKPLDLEMMLRLIRERGVSRVIDATHPFALEVTATAKEACRLAAVPYERVERERQQVEGGQGVIRVAGVPEAARFAAGMEGTVFLTTGSGTLDFYAGIIGPQRLVVRILPLASSLDRCLRLGIPPSRIVAMQGPFTEELNRLLFERYGAALIISKDSGPAGGTPEKVRAARALSIPIVIIAQPEI